MTGAADDRTTRASASNVSLPPVRPTLAPRNSIVAVADDVPVPVAVTFRIKMSSTATASEFVPTVADPSSDSRI